MALNITDTEIASDLVATRTEFRPDAAADGRGAWIVSDRPGRLFTLELAITAPGSDRDHAFHACLRSLLVAGCQLSVADTAR
jgi:hypothetical protein